MLDDGNPTSTSASSNQSEESKELSNDASTEIDAKNQEATAEEAKVEDAA